MDYYFDANSLNSDTVDKKRIDKLALWKMPFQIAEIRLVSRHPEVYEPCADSFALVDALLSDRTDILKLKPRLCLEVGSGSGYVIASLAIMLRQQTSGIQYFTTDINPHAAETTASTLEAHGVHAEIICTNLASGLEKRLAGMVDLIVVSRPYMPTLPPTLDEEFGCEGITSWAGGENGQKVINTILPLVHNLLSERGSLYVVTVNLNNPVPFRLMMRKMGYASRTVLITLPDDGIVHILKFWRENTVAKSSRCWLSHLSLLSFWRSIGFG